MVPATKPKPADLSNLPDVELLEIGTTAASNRRQQLAWKELRERHADGLISWLQTRYGFSPSVAEDVASDTWSRLYRHGHKYQRKRAKVQSYIYMIAKRLAANVHRDEGRSPTLPASEIDRRRTGENRSILAESPSPKPGPADRLEASELEGKVWGAISDLADHYRAPVRLRAQGYTYGQIADLTGVKLGTVKSRLNRGRQQLKKRLADRGVDLGEYLQLERE